MIYTASPCSAICVRAYVRRSDGTKLLCQPGYLKVLKQFALSGDMFKFGIRSVCWKVSVWGALCVCEVEELQSRRSLYYIGDSQGLGEEEGGKGMDCQMVCGIFLIFLMG